MTQTITKHDLESFIQAQPDDRPVDMLQNHSEQPCGCVMVHYGRQFIDEPFVAGYATLRVQTSHNIMYKLDHDAQVFMSGIIFQREAKTYGDIK